MFFGTIMEKKAINSQSESGTKRFVATMKQKWARTIWYSVSYQQKKIINIHHLGRLQCLDGYKQFEAYYLSLDFMLIHFRPSVRRVSADFHPFDLLVCLIVSIKPPRKQSVRHRFYSHWTISHFILARPSISVAFPLKVFEQQLAGQGYSWNAQIRYTYPRTRTFGARLVVVIHKIGFSTESTGIWIESDTLACLHSHCVIISGAKNSCTTIIVFYYANNISNLAVSKFCIIIGQINVFIPT